MGPEFAISEGNGRVDSVNPIAFDGENFFVAWVAEESVVIGHEVKGRLVSPTGTLGAEFTVNASPDYSDNPLAVGFDGTNYLVVWDDEVGGYESGEGGLFGQRVSTSGTLVGEVISVSDAPGHRIAPSIAFDGTNYLIVWTDMRNDADYDTICDASEGTCIDIYGQYINTAGELVGAEFVINNDPGNQLGVVAAFADGKYLVLISDGFTFNLNTWGDVHGVFITP